ncbi:MAG: prepilin peptidase [Clostridiales bacterium]|nr:prepilin peptidase [Clostridiales bacterium]MBS5877592.1 prepilin peptidase [Clostridiales bacterium]MDU0939795.1 prepilin peptidase [Clostridiales bacterium]MDU1042055.1 prepilin peptidase [Clostridiales bacterium]
MIESVILLVYTGLLGIEDIKRESISVWQAAAGVMIGIVLNLTLDKDLLQGFISGSAGLIVGMLVMLLTRGGAGAGDISMFFIVSMIMGIERSVWVFIFACVTLLMTNACLYSMKRVKIYAFIPFIAAGIGMEITAESIWRI